MNHLIEHVDVQLAIVVDQSWCSPQSVLASFLQLYSEWPKWCYFIHNAAMSDRGIV